MFNAEVETQLREKKTKDEVKEEDRSNKTGKED